MNRLTTAKRIMILSMLVEGMSMRAISRTAGVSINTAAKLLVDAGEACATFHDGAVRGVTASRIQCDAIWSFCHAEQKNVAKVKAAPWGASDLWTWTALEADSKLTIAWEVGDRSAATAIAFMDDLRARLANRVRLTTDGHNACLDAVEGTFGGDADYAMLVKLYGDDGVGKLSERKYSPPVCVGARKQQIEGRPDLEAVSTSFAERRNLAMRVGMHRFTQLTDAFSKKLTNHLHMLSLYFVHYNFVRVHKTLRVTPAMAAGVDGRLRDMEWIVGLMDARAPKPKRPAAYRKQVSN